MTPFVRLVEQLNTAHARLRLACDALGVSPEDVNLLDLSDEMQSHYLALGSADAQAAANLLRKGTL